MPAPAVLDDTTMGGWPYDYFRASLRGSVSPENVHDSHTHGHLLAAQRTRLVGFYATTSCPASSGS